ncbi:MAG: hypothetical protein WC992_07690 [Acholeplasmataceae bacterium]
MNIRMKATVTRLIERDKKLKGTDNYAEQHMECSSKFGNDWVFVGWSVPYDVEYEVMGTQSGIFLERSIDDHTGGSTHRAERYRIRANNIKYIDFKDHR